MTVIGNDLAGEILQDSLVSQVTHVVIVGEPIDHAYPDSRFMEFFRDGFANAFRAAGDDGHFLIQHDPSSSVCVQVHRLFRKSCRTEFFSAGENSAYALCQMMIPSQ